MKADYLNSPKLAASILRECDIVAFCSARVMHRSSTFAGRKRTISNARGVISSVVVLISFILLNFPRPAIAQFDQVYPLRGAPMNGQVVETTKTEVTIKVQGSDRKVAVNEIRRIGFKEDPAELKVARSRVETGNFQSAKDELKKINVAEVMRPIIRQDLQFYLAYCDGKLALSSGGDKAKAAGLMLAFVRSASNSHHFFDAAETLGDLAVSLGKPQEALKYYGAIASAPWPDYKMHAAMLEARALLAQEDYAAAQTKFETLASARSTTPETNRQKLLAEVGKARCMVETASPDEAIKTVEQIITSNDESDAELFGRAYNAMGAAYLKLNKPKEALMAYLHSDVLFYSQPDIHAEALFHLTKLWEQAKNPDRAVAAKNMLMDRYAGSRWASMQ